LKTKSGFRAVLSFIFTALRVTFYFVVVFLVLLVVRIAISQIRLCSNPCGIDKVINLELI
jgi:hypothetical protein